MTEDTATVVRRGVEHAFKDFTARIDSLGFARTKKTKWSRKNIETVDFIHLHRRGISYGAGYGNSVSIRVHLGIRVLNDLTEHLVLNGPSSDSPEFHSFRYHFRFNALSGSTYERCIDDLTRFISDQAEPWFKRYRTPEALLTGENSPLTTSAKKSLKEAMESRRDSNAAAASLKLLGIKDAA